MPNLFLVTPAVDHGVALAGTFANRPTGAHHGARYFCDDLQREIVYNSKLRTWFATDGKTLYDSTSKYLSDCFRGVAIDNGYDLGKGSDAQAAYAVLDTDQVNGQVDMVTGDAGTGTAADISSLAHALSLTPEDHANGILYGIRFQLSAITTVAFNLGFTDAKPSTTLEMPITLATATFTTNATNAIIALLDTAATTDTLRLHAVDSDTDATTPVDTSEALDANAHELLIFVDNTGLATFYLDETELGSVQGPADVALFPFVGVEARTTASRTLSASWFFCHPVD